MPAQPVEPLFERSPETDLLMALVADVAAGRTQLRVVAHHTGNGMELRLAPVSIEALDLKDLAGAAYHPAGSLDPERAMVASLSPRERTVLRLVADGLTNRQIAAELHLAEKTVRNRLSMVFAKLGIERRSQAAAFAVRNGLSGPTT